MEDDLLAEIKRRGAVVEGHFIGTAGKHLDTYLAKDAIMPHTDLVSRICARIAEHAVSLEPDVVVGPVACGIIISQWTAHHLSCMSNKKVLSLFTDEVENVQKLKRKYNRLVEGARVIVVEDVVNTGKSIKEVVDGVVNKGGSVVHAFSIFNRGVPDEEMACMLGVPYKSLFYFPLKTYEPEFVPQWLERIPISNEYGYGGPHISGRKDN